MIFTISSHISSYRFWENYHLSNNFTSASRQASASQFIRAHHLTVFRDFLLQRFETIVIFPTYTHATISYVFQTTPAQQAPYFIPRTPISVEFSVTQNTLCS